MNTTRPYLLIPLIIAFSAIWSSAFIGGKIAVHELPPMLVLTARFLLSCLVMLPLCLGNIRALLDPGVIRTGLLLGLLNNALYLGLTFTSLHYISAAVVVVMVSCAPFITLLLSAVCRLEQLNRRTLLGITLGFAGVLIIVGLDAIRPDPLGIFLALLGTCAFATGTVLFRGKASGLPILQLNFWQSAAGVIALAPLTLLTSDTELTPSPASIWAILYLAIIVTMGGTALWLLLIRISGAATASSYHLLNPFFGVLLSHWVLGTPLQPHAFAGAIVIAIGLSLTVRPRRNTVYEPASQGISRHPHDDVSRSG
ncbi:EamA/RhaT family transporter [Pokkaliibacter plantistimulans]|uniref:EamA/RhaT family transporter n=1 Tax=Proteobacteria bacterium 228 TaxID=2083153 RepID=A0A2S5KKD6_9PROT|nr:DMT family transporter [Pokkaliibacter plantistimulans]PPC75304.1 EamA/RhaT family transporter [Pokkaliibacter plantistimulans]